MSIEHSNGKARPTLPRSSDLATMPADGERDRDGRRSDGTFGPGNGGGRGRGWKAALHRIAGRGVTLPDEDSARVADDAWRILCATIRELPHDGANVRGLVSLKAMHEAMAGYWSAKAFAVGLATQEGLAATAEATKHGIRAERLAVTSIDVAVRLARAERPKENPHSTLVAALETER